MKRRYVLAPEAARDLANIWHYVKRESSKETADRVESGIRGKFAYLADFPNGGITGVIWLPPKCGFSRYIPT